MAYSTDKGREQIAAQRRVVAARKKRRLELAAPKLLAACQTALTAATVPFHGDVKAEATRVIKVIEDAIKEAGQ